jgi:hypothetical protein
MNMLKGLPSLTHNAVFHTNHVEQTLMAALATEAITEWNPHITDLELV